jgi:hypothetical protein
MVERADFGAMKTLSQGNLIPEGIAIGIDNECFLRPEKFGDGQKYIEMVADTAEREVLFATAPDVVGNWEATLERSLPWSDRLRGVGVPAAIVGQDGACDNSVPWDAFDVLFLGGTTEWKLGADAAELVACAKRRGLWVHMGRVNSLKRLRYADAIGCDSADGTCIAFGPDVNLQKVIRWLDDVNWKNTLF